MFMFNASNWLFKDDKTKFDIVVRTYKISMTSVDISDPETSKLIKTSIMMSTSDLRIESIDDIDIFTISEFKSLCLRSRIENEESKERIENEEERIETIDFKHRHIDTLMSYLNSISNVCNFIYARIKIKKTQISIRSKSIFYTYVLHNVKEPLIKLYEGQMFNDVKNINLDDHVEIIDGNNLKSKYKVTVYPSKISILFTVTGILLFSTFRIIK